MHGNQKCGSRPPWTRVAAYGGLTLTSNSVRGCHAAFKGAAPKSKAPRLGLVWLSVVDGCHRARLKNRGCSFRSILGKKLSVEREFGQCSYERHRPRLDGDVVRSETDFQLTCTTRRSCRPVFYILVLFKGAPRACHELEAPTRHVVWWSSIAWLMTRLTFEIHLFKATLGRSALGYQCSGRVVALGLMHCKPPDGHDRVVQIVEFLRCSNMQRLTSVGVNSGLDREFGRHPVRVSIASAHVPIQTCDSAAEVMPLVTRLVNAANIL